MENKDLDKLILILNGKVDLCISLFERLEHLILNLHISSRDKVNQRLQETKKQYNELREFFADYETKLCGGINADSEL